eukprot:Rmarinus@m.28960
MLHLGLKTAKPLPLRVPASPLKIPAVRRRKQPRSAPSRPPAWMRIAWSSASGSWSSSSTSSHSFQRGDSFLRCWRTFTSSYAWSSRRSLATVTRRGRGTFSRS